MNYLESYNKAFNYLLDKYGYKYKVYTPAALNILKYCKTEKEKEDAEKLFTKEHYYYFIDDSKIEEIDAVMMVLMSNWKNDINAKKNLVDLLTHLNIIE